MPAIKGKAKSLIAGTPRIYSANTVSNVVSEVLTLLDKVWFILSLTS